MSVHKDEKTGKWYYTGKYRDLAGKRHDYKKRGFKTKKEALEAEQYLRSVELKEKSFNSKATSPLSSSFPESAMQALCNSRDFP